MFNEQMTWALFFQLSIIFITKGLPTLIGLMCLFRLREKSMGDSKNLARFLQELVTILACLAMITLSWAVSLGLASVCVTMIIMNSIKPPAE